jgi:N-acetyl-anhydromuramyl-L-alanine amidase AmpD
MPKTKRRIAREVDEILAKPLPRYAQGHSVVIDHDDIPPSVMRIALGNAKRDPDGQVFPWRSMYPLIGATVYFDGRLWTVARKERGPGSEQPTAEVQLVGQGHDDEAIATRGELRPVTWTQHDEDWLGRE